MPAGSGGARSEPHPATSKTGRARRRSFGAAVFDRNVFMIFDSVVCARQSQVSRRRASPTLAFLSFGNCLISEALHIGSSLVRANIDQGSRLWIACQRLRIIHARGRCAFSRKWSPYLGWLRCGRGSSGAAAARSVLEVGHQQPLFPQRSSGAKSCVTIFRVQGEGRHQECKRIAPASSVETREVT